jgi:hypothetical protein
LVLVSVASALAQQATTVRIVKSANAFLATLDAKQKQSVQFAFNDAEQRKRWSNLPTSMVKRAGLKMGELNAAQRAAAMDLLATTLSKKGYQKVQEIMDGDQVLHDTERNGAMFGRDLFYISFLGAPSEKDPWLLQFGGHHLALNITIAGEHGVLTPTLTAAQPALYQKDGKTVRPLGGESDKAVALVNALDTNQKKQAILSYKVSDLVLGPGEDGKTIQPEGLKVSAMNDKQKQMLLDVIEEWSGIINESTAAARMAEIKAGLNDTYFAWSGPTTVEPGKSTVAYYRIQGPALVIEFSPQPLGGDLSLHVHTMYRDPTNDYGRKYSGK